MAILQVTTKPEHIKKTGPVNHIGKKSDKGDDMFSILLSMSMNAANQPIKDTGLADNKIEEKPVSEAADKKEGSNEENELKDSGVQGVKDSSEMSKNMPLTKVNENPPLNKGGNGGVLSGDNPNPHTVGDEISLPFNGRRIQIIPSPLRGEGQGGGELRGKYSEQFMSREIVPGAENGINLRQAQDDKHGLMESFTNNNNQRGADTTSDSKSPFDILPENIINTQIENLDNDKLLNDNGMLVTAVKGTLVNTEGNNISSQSVYRYVDQGNLVPYMTQQIIHASHTGSHTAKIRLRPAELGDLRLDISVADKNVKALIVVENEEIKKMVESGFNSLRDELKNHGLNVEQFSVEIQKEDFMDNFNSMYKRHEEGSKKWANIIPDINPGSMEHPALMPVLSGIGVRGGLSLFA